jgi:hypothetical protein
VAEPPLNPQAVQWSVRSGLEGADVGQIDASGKFTAPHALTQAVEVTVVARSGDEEGTATVNLRAAAVASQPSDVDANSGAVTPPATAPAGAITIEPQSAVLAGRAVQRFEARDSTGQPVAATWSLAGIGGLTAGDIGTIDATSGSYTAPADVTFERNVIVVAKVAGGPTDKAFIVLTPGALRVVPAEVTLRANEPQQFTALVHGDPSSVVEWQLSPDISAHQKQTSPSKTFLFKAPDGIKEDAKVVVTAISKTTGMVGHSEIKLLADPWIGRGPHVLGFWLLFVAIIVPLLYVRWPPPNDRAALVAAVAAREQAERLAQQRQAAVTKLTTALDDFRAKAKAAAASAPPNDNLVQELRAQIEQTQGSLTAAGESLQEAARDTEAKKSAETAERQRQSDDRDDERLLFILVLLAGALGSFVHTTRSFVDFMGNRRLRQSWTWWYILQPFTGSALAMVMYFVIRGGFLASATGTEELNPWGFVAVAALVGLFSKQATNKLDELFSTMFKTDKERELSDKLQPRTNNTTQTGNRT